MRCLPAGPIQFEGTGVVFLLDVPNLERDNPNYFSCNYCKSLAGEASRNSFGLFVYFLFVYGVSQFSTLNTFPIAIVQNLTTIKLFLLIIINLSYRVKNLTTWLCKPMSLI